jgi:hypothetical protein
MYRPAHAPVAQTRPGVFMFLSLSGGIGGEVVLEVEEADPEVVQKCACGQWGMGVGRGVGRGAGLGLHITCGLWGSLHVLSHIRIQI